VAWYFNVATNSVFTVILKYLFLQKNKRSGANKFNDSAVLAVVRAVEERHLLI
jgi:hypothetical protein